MAGFGKSWRGLMEDLSRAVASEEKAAAQASWDRDNAAFSQSRRPEARGMTPTRMGVPDQTKWGADEDDMVLSPALRRLLDDPSTRSLSEDISNASVFERGPTALSYLHKGDRTNIFDLETDIASRGQGSARAAMEEFLRGQDAAGRSTYLTASPTDGRTTQAGLDRFYESLGFRPAEDAEGFALRRAPAQNAKFSLDDPKFGGGSALPAKPQGVGAIMGKLLASPEARLENAASAKVSRMPFRDHQMDVYDFPSGANVRFHPAPDGTVEVVMGASKVGPASPASLKAQVFADAMSAVERHAKETGAAQKGASYLFSGETDAITRMFRAMGERAQLPGGAVMHDSPGGFEISFDPSRKPFEGRSAMGLFDSEAGYGLGFNRDMKPSEIINARARQLGGPMVGGTPEALARAREQGWGVDEPMYRGAPAGDGLTINSRGVWMTSDPDFTSSFAGKDGVVYPLLTKGKFFNDQSPADIETARPFLPHLSEEFDKPWIDREYPWHLYETDESIDGLKRAGFDGFEFLEEDRPVRFAFSDPGGGSQNIRSRFAAFDPAKKDSTDLLASALLGTTAAGGATALGSGDAEAKPYAPKLAALSKAGNAGWAGETLQGGLEPASGKQALQGDKNLAMAEAGVLASSPAAFSLGYYLLNDPTMQGNVAMDRAEQEWADEASRRTQQLREDYFKPHDPWREAAKQQTFNEKLTPSEQFNSWISPFFEAAASNVPDNALNPWQGEARKQLTGQDVQRTRDAMDESAFAFPLWAQSRAQQPIDLLGDALEMADPTWFGVGAARDWVDKRKTKRQALAAGLQKRKN